LKGLREKQLKRQNKKGVKKIKMKTKLFDRGDKKDFKSLVWYYFMQQKAIEILSIPFFILVPYFIGRAIPGSWFGDGSVFFTWFVGLSILLISILCLIGVACLVYIFIKSNWNLAKKRAREKLK